MFALVEKTPKLKGVVRAPSSKSYSHRAIISATLCHDTTRIVSPLNCEDVDSTLRACVLFGAHVAETVNELSITGPVKLKAPNKIIDCRDSGSTLRFLVPISALAQGRTVLTGSPQLAKRPLGPLFEALRQLGVECASSNGHLPVTVDGNGLNGGVTSIRGDISSQFITGLLLAAPLAQEETEIQVTNRLESKPYMSLTMNILEKHGIKVEASTNLRKFRIPPNQKYRTTTHIVPGDYSSAAFLMAAAAITGSSIGIDNLVPGQPDSSILLYLRQMGISIETVENRVQISGGDLAGIEVDARDCPDLVPVIAVLGCKAAGITRIIHAKRLRYKESDRLSSIAQELQKFGAKISEDCESLTVVGSKTLVGAKVESHQDHRIAMACTILGLASKGRTEITHAECVEKSYPRFFKDLKSLGGRVDVR
ncbi:3-phosphoshikimate 1-carboxyvinyltransferase [Candidatus Bathyarchaeota archaeon]|nr:3-phosphoshikimate 1-carboxyvinyltransferase [Candidatus Bathyarchaeota archaeon]